MGRRKVKVANLLLVILVAGLLVLVIYFLLSMPVKNIIINNNKIYSEEEILELTGLKTYPSFITINSFMINNKIKNEELIDKITLKRKFFNKIILDVKEQRVLFYDDYEHFYILENGKNIKTDKDIIIPRINNYIPKHVKIKFIQSFKQIKDDSLMMVSEVKYDPSEFDKSRFLMYMNDGNYVYINNANMDNLNYYLEIVKVLENKKGVLYLDNGGNEAVQFKVLE